MLIDYSKKTLQEYHVSAVPFVGLLQEFAERRQMLTAAFESVGSSASYILRDDVRAFETAIADKLAVKFAIGVNSGTDALFLALKALGIGVGDEVITVAHTFVATLAAIVHCGAKPVLIDIGQDFNLVPDALQAAITPATKAIIPVHMNGRCCDMPAILAIADKYGVPVVEDAAQALGAHIDGRYAGSFGRLGAFSLHPMKNLHCYGDGGLVTTNDPLLAEKIRMLRNHGQNENKDLMAFGFNSRLDNLQAALLNVNLRYFADDIDRRRQIAARYHAGLSDCQAVRLPVFCQPTEYFDVFSAYPILCRDRDGLIRHLQSRHIECFVHWPQPLHLNPHLQLAPVSLPMTEQVAREVLSLPIHPFLDDAQCDYVIASVREFAGGR